VETETDAVPYDRRPSHLFSIVQMKELLAHRAAHAKLVVAAKSEENNDKNKAVKKASSPKNKRPVESEVQAMDMETRDKPATKRVETESSTEPPAKRKKIAVTSQNFLGIRAKKAKEARSARSAARVGLLSAKQQKASNTGSGMPLPQVIKFKYVKGFTEAVRTPCRLEDLL
jgi:chromosome transmission fidelity protein 18